MTEIAAIATALTELITLGYKAFALFKEAKEKGWIKDGRLLSAAITEAKTDEERAKLAKLLFDRINN